MKKTEPIVYKDDTAMNSEFVDAKKEIQTHTDRSGSFSVNYDSAPTSPPERSVSDSVILGSHSVSVSPVRRCESDSQNNELFLKRS